MEELNLDGLRQISEEAYQTRVKILGEKARLQKIVEVDSGTSPLDELAIRAEAEAAAGRTTATIRRQTTKRSEADIIEAELRELEQQVQADGFVTCFGRCDPNFEAGRYRDYFESDQYLTIGWGGGSLEDQIRRDASSKPHEDEDSF